MNAKKWIAEFCETDSGPYRRPFSPNTDWENADVLIVGTNPATPMRDEFTSFEQYWRGLTIDPSIYWDKYRQQHGGKSSRSTSNASILLGLLEPLNVLVTNVVWFPARKKREIPKSEWAAGEQAIRILFNHVKPSVVFCHGADAERFAKSISPNANRYLSAQDQLKANNHETLVLCYHHFSGQGLRKGTRFSPTLDLPAFSKCIRAHIKMIE